MEKVRRASGKAPHAATAKTSEAVAHPGASAMAVLDAAGISAWSVEAVQNPRRLYALFTTGLELNTLT